MYYIYLFNFSLKMPYRFLVHRWTRVDLDYELCLLREWLWAALFVCHKNRDRSRWLVGGKQVLLTIVGWRKTGLWLSSIFQKACHLLLLYTDEQMTHIHAVTSPQLRSLQAEVRWGIVFVCFSLENSTIKAPAFTNPWWQREQWWPVAAEGPEMRRASGCIYSGCWKCSAS